MDNKIKACLLDIERSIDEIFDFLGANRDFASYKLSGNLLAWVKASNS